MRSKDGDNKHGHDQSCKETRKTCRLLYADDVDFFLFKRMTFFIHERAKYMIQYQKNMTLIGGLANKNLKTTLIIIPDVTKN